MKTTGKAIIAYIIFIFALQSLAVFFSPFAAQIYLSFAIIAMGLTAILFQKLFHRAKFIDMGFRLNRNALIGIVLALLSTAIILLTAFWLPLRLGLIDIRINEDFPASETFTEGASPLVPIAIILAVGVPLGLLACLFGEELAFRGYILPKFEERLGGLWAVILSSAVFAVWHLPAYFSIYKGGEAEEGGWPAIALMLVGHGVSVVPICILYMTTRELYGVSLYHTLVNTFQYSIVMNPAFGETSKLAIYRSEVLNQTAVNVLGYAITIGSIPLMLGLCAVAKKFTIKYSPVSSPPDA